MLDTGKPVFSWAKQLKQEEQGDHGGSGDCRDRDMQWQSRLWRQNCSKGKQHQRGPIKHHPPLHMQSFCARVELQRATRQHRIGSIGFPYTSSPGNGFWLLLAAWPSQLPLNLGKHVLLENPHTSACFCFGWLPALLWWRIFWDPVSLYVYSSLTPYHFCSTPPGPPDCAVCLQWAPCPSWTLWEKGSLK